MRVVITGGSGFIGSNLVESYCRSGEDVLNLDITPPRDSTWRGVWREMDVSDASALDQALVEFAPQIVFHMAGRTDLDGRSVDDYAANTNGVANLIAALARLDSVQRVVFASSRLVCRIGYEPRDEFDYCPTTAYGESKMMGEKLVRQSGHRIRCPWMIVRPTSIWGPWFDVPYKTFFLAIAKGHYVHPGNRTILKSFGFVGNSVYQLRRLVDAAKEKVYGRTFYLADYPPIDVALMATAIQQALHVAPIRTVGVPWLRCAAMAGDALKLLGWRNPPLTSFRLANLLTPMVHDLDSLRAVVGELPYTMEQGVKITVQWLKARGEVT